MLAWHHHFARLKFNFYCVIIINKLINKMTFLIKAIYYMKRFIKICCTGISCYINSVLIYDGKNSPKSLKVDTCSRASLMTSLLNLNALFTWNQYEIFIFNLYAVVFVFLRSPVKTLVTYCYLFSSVT